MFKTEEGKTVIEVPVKATYDFKNDQSFRAHLFASNFVIPKFTGQFDVNSVRGLR